MLVSDIVTGAIIPAVSKEFIVLGIDEFIGVVSKLVRLFSDRVLIVGTLAILLDSLTSHPAETINRNPL